MAIDGPSMPIRKSCDVHRWVIDGPSKAHRWAAMGPSMGLNGVSVRATCNACFTLVLLILLRSTLSQEFSGRLHKFCRGSRKLRPRKLRPRKLLPRKIRPRKLSYAKRKAAIILRLLFEEVSMFVVGLGRFAPFAK